jgi:hypothetical protein
VQTAVRYRTGMKVRTCLGLNFGKYSYVAALPGWSVDRYIGM